MADVPFEGEKSVKTSRLKKDEELFKEMVQKLGFKMDLNLVTFCAAVVLRLEQTHRTVDKRPLLTPKKLAGMESFEKRDLYDLVISDYLDVKIERLRQFETFFYTGFHFLKDWLEQDDGESQSEIERFLGIWDYVVRNRESG